MAHAKVKDVHWKKFGFQVLQITSEWNNLDTPIIGKVEKLLQKLLKLWKMKRYVP